MPKKETWRDLRRRARWDRIFGAFAVMVLLLVWICSGIRSCAKKMKEEREGRKERRKEGRHLYV